MTNGLIKERNTLFVNGYAVQWFANILKKTKILIYTKIPNHKYVLMSELTLDGVADEFSVENAARNKILEVESL